MVCQSCGPGAPYYLPPSLDKVRRVKRGLMSSPHSRKPVLGSKELEGEGKGWGPRRGCPQAPCPAAADPSPCPVFIHSEYNWVRCFSPAATKHQHFSGKSFPLTPDISELSFVGRVRKVGKLRPSYGNPGWQSQRQLPVRSPVELCPTHVFILRMCCQNPILQHASLR